MPEANGPEVAFPVASGKGRASRASLAYQLARVASGGLAALFFGKALDLSVEGGYSGVTYVLFFGLGGLFVLLTIWLSLVIHGHKEAAEATPRTRPLTWGDLKQMRVPVEPDSGAEMKGPRNDAPDMSMPS